MLLTLLLALAFQPVLSVTLTPNQPFRVEWWASPDDAFRWWCNDEIKQNFTTAQLTKDPTPDASGAIRYEAQVPGMPAGTYSCQVSAYTPLGIESKSAPIPVTMAMTGAPRTPFGLRVIVVVK